MTRAAGHVAAPVTVTGLLRVTEPGGAFLRSNDPVADRWFSRDVAGIAKARGLGRTAPYFVDADASPNPGGYPVDRKSVVSVQEWAVRVDSGGRRNLKTKKNKKK